MADDETIRPSSLKEGWNRLARDLDRAIPMARLHSTQRFLLQQAMEASWSRASEQGREAEPFQLNLTQLAGIIGLDRCSLSRQFHQMVRRNIFVPVGDGTFHINKDYRSWVDSAGRALFTEDQIAWCLAAAKRPKRRKKPITPNPENVTHCDVPRHAPDLPVVMHCDVPRHSASPPTSQCVTTDVTVHYNPTFSANGHEERTSGEIASPPPDPPIRKRASEEFKKNSEEELTHTHRGHEAPQSQKLRDPLDSPHIEDAIKLLAADSLTEHIAMRLGREHQTPGLVGLPGWRFVAAAHRLMARDHDQKQSWPYYLKIARSVVAPEANGGAAAPPAENIAARQRRERKAQVERMKRLETEARNGRPG